MGHLSRSASDLTGLDNATLDDNDTTYTVRGGWRFSTFAAIELGYYDLGRYDFHGTRFESVGNVDGSMRAQSVGLSLVGIWPINDSYWPASTSASSRHRRLQRAAGSLMHNVATRGRLPGRNAFLPDATAACFP